MTAVEGLVLNQELKILKITGKLLQSQDEAVGGSSLPWGSPW